MTPLGTWLYTLFRGRRIGKDRFGNRYYRRKAPRHMQAGMRKERRWVLYKGDAEASKIPPEWHAWLHYTVENPPEKEGPIYDWQTEHKPNMTGTPDAYRPSGHTTSVSPRAGNSGDYEPWTPS